jgi:hypothetical protein
MIRPTCVYGLVALATLATMRAEDFPLTFRTIPAKDVMAFPGGYGAFGTLRTAKPAALKKEPRAISAHPLYGQCGDVAISPTFLFRLDESKGDGTDYDQFILDMNQNGDLTDDPVVQRVASPSDRRRSSRPDEALFGPIEAPADRMIAGGRPVYYAQTYLYNSSLLRRGKETRNLNVTFGRLRLRAAWYLDTTVAINGVKQKVGVYDGDSNLRLGDVSRPQTTTSRGETTWYFRSADTLLVDADSSGAFETDRFESESEPFGPILYLAHTPYALALSADARTLQVQPWTASLAEVALAPHGDQVRSVTLAREQPEGQWALIHAGVADGKVRVPPGNYRLYACDLLGKAGPREQVMASAYQRVLQKPVRFVTGKANALRCGAPLEIKVTAEKTKGGPLDLLRRDSATSKSDSDVVLRINADVQGAGGEAYSSYAKGESFQAQPAKPTFLVTDADGKKLGDGNLEYG